MVSGPLYKFNKKNIVVYSALSNQKTNIFGKTFKSEINIGKIEFRIFNIRIPRELEIFNIHGVRYYLKSKSGTTFSVSASGKKNEMCSSEFIHPGNVNQSGEISGYRIFGKKKWGKFIG